MSLFPLKLPIPSLAICGCGHIGAHHREHHERRRSHPCTVCLCGDFRRRQVDVARVAMRTINVEAAEIRGAFRALAEFGCAVQLGMLAVAMASRQVCRWDGPEPGVRVWGGAVERSLLVALGSKP